MTSINTCQQCGHCCRSSGSPVLFIEDLDLLADGVLTREDLYVLRPGETVFEPREQSLIHLKHDLIKIKETAAGCLKLADRQCSIHGRHPRQCRELNCRENKPPLKLARLTRKIIFKQEPKIWRLVEEYDQAMPAAQVAEALMRAGRAAGSLSEALDMVNRDMRLRFAAEQVHGCSQQLLALMWGRPVKDIMTAYGLTADQTG